MKNSLDSPQELSPNAQKEELYEVEEILEKKSTPKGDLYLIRWKGFDSPNDYTWQPIRNLKRVQALVRKFNLAQEKKLAEEKKKKSSEPPEEMVVIEIESDSTPKEKEKVQKKIVKTAKKQLPKEKKIVKPKPKPQKQPVQKEKQSKKIITPKAPQKVLPRRQEKPQKRQSQIHFLGNPEAKLGRIFNHYYQQGTLKLNVNIENSLQQICGMSNLTASDMLAQDQEKVLCYMQGWSRNLLIEHLQRKSNEMRQFQAFWKEIQ